MENISDVNDRIKILREAEELSQAKFGEKISLERSSISLMERKQRNVTDRVVSDICRVFGVNRDWLMTGEGDLYTTIDEKFVYMSANASDNSDDIIKELTKILWSLDVDEIKALKSVLSKIKKIPGI